ncbi:MAG TPA: GAF domain-containing protein [Burkholderiaceae bacterium]
MTDLGVGAALVLPLDVCVPLCENLARAQTADTALRHIDAARVDLLGAGLLTINLDVTAPGDPPDEVQLQRWWSSEPDAYPVGGRKRKTATPWTMQLVRRAEVFVGEGPAALAEVFNDYARIAALGLQAVVNVPVLDTGRCVATFNVLGTRPRWQAHEIACVRLLALLATPWVPQGRRGACLEPIIGA